MPTKSSSLDVMPMWLFKNCLTELIHVVHHIVNTSLASGMSPTALKSAMLKPATMKFTMDPDDLKSYRPISNLTYLSKIIEKTAHIQLFDYVNNNKLLSAFQSGYRRNHSCETAVTKIHNDILLMTDKRKNVILLLLDLSAAFDTINHGLLLTKLNTTYGLSGKVLMWLKSYLSCRSFKVTIKNSSSDSCL